MRCRCCSCARTRSWSARSTCTTYSGQASPDLDPGSGDTAIRDLIVVPARYGSTRLPGKPLIEIAGATLLERVARVASRAAAIAGDVDVVVATDDLRIEAHARAIGCAVAMTDRAISSGSGRACATALGRTVRPRHVVNLQGDAPFVPPDVVATLLAAARDTGAAATTPVVRMGWDDLDALREHKRSAPFSGTTCIRRPDGRAIWFSKTIIPTIRDEADRRRCDARSPVYRHLGLYAYRLDALEAFERTAPTPYETAEGLEQLRFIEMGLDVMTIEVTPPPHAISGIDTAEDVALAERLIARIGDPHHA